jgi:hypothetical protein
MDPVFAIKQPDAFITNTASSLHLSLVPPGTAPIAFRLGKRPRSEVLQRGATFTPNFLQKIT